MSALLAETAHDLMVRLTEEEKQCVGEKLRRQAVRNLISSTVVMAGIILSAWKRICETLEEEGFEGRQLARHCKLLFDGIEWIMPAYDRFLAQTAECGLTPEAAGLRDLEAKLPALREVCPKVAEILELANRPPRPIDEAMLNKSKEAVERGQFVILDEEYLAHLRAGQDF